MSTDVEDSQSRIESQSVSDSDLCDKVGGAATSEQPPDTTVALKQLMGHSRPAKRRRHASLDCEGAVTKGAPGVQLNPSAKRQASYGGKGCRETQRLAGRPSLDDADTATRVPTPLHGSPYLTCHGVQLSNTGAGYSGVDPDLLGLTLSRGCTSCFRRREFETELTRRRTRAEDDYASRLRSLAAAARALEVVLRKRSESVCSAESGRAQADLEAIISGAVDEVNALLDEDRRNRDSLRAELRAATAASHGLNPITRAMSTDNPDSVAMIKSQAAHQQKYLRDCIKEAAEQLRMEREGHSQALKQVTQQLQEERAATRAQLRDQAATIALLRPRGLEAGKALPI